MTANNPNSDILQKSYELYVNLGDLGDWLCDVSVELGISPDRKAAGAKVLEVITMIDGKAVRIMQYLSDEVLQDLATEALEIAMDGESEV